MCLACIQLQGQLQAPNVEGRRKRKEGDRERRKEGRKE
jgi:hypothetical protein